jgi:hypothetical protein
MQSNGTPPLLLRVPTAAPQIGISPRRLYELAAKPGALPEGLVVRLGRSLYISRQRLEEWLGNGQSAGQSSERVPANVD